jgi:hypothetical protein
MKIAELAAGNALPQRGVDGEWLDGRVGSKPKVRRGEIQGP